MDQDNQAVLKKAVSLLKEGRAQQAQQILADLALKNPQDPQVWFLLAYALPQRDRKIYALKQTLKLQPGHEKARQMLAKLESAPPPTADTPQPPAQSTQEEPVLRAASTSPANQQVVSPFQIDDSAAPEGEQPKRARSKLNPLWFIGGGLLIGIIAVGAFLAFGGGLESLFGLAQAPTDTPAATTVQQTTPLAGLTMLPTWTVTITSTQTDIPTPTPTPLSTETPTPLPLPAETRAEIALIQQQVEGLRSLSPAQDINNEIMPKVKLKLLMLDIFVDEAYLASLDDEQIIMKTLGFMDHDYDLVNETLNSRADGIGGFYEPDTNWIHVIGIGFDGMEKWIYAHEYAHALQDEHFDLTSLGVYPYCEKALQACLATRALVEGEAEVVQEMWLENYPPELTINDYYNFDKSTPLFQGEPPPPYYGMNAYFPYSFGYEFASYLYQRGGWNQLNQAYQRLPSTTEQIMHPQKYLSNSGAIPVNDPDIIQALTPSWRLLRRDALGEWETFLLLGYAARSEAQRPEQEAFEAAEGWGGDTYQIYYHDDNKQAVLAAHWSWDTSADAGEFYASFKASLNGRFQNAVIDGPGGGDCWLYEGRFSCIYTAGRDVLWMLAPELGILESIKALFPQFP